MMLPVFLMSEVRIMTKPVVEYRWVELLSLDHAVELLELERLREYGFTGATLWASFERPLDTYFYTLPVVYRRFSELNGLRDQVRIRQGADFLREFSRRAHQRGLTVQHVYHLCNFVGGQAVDATVQLRAHKTDSPLQQVHPEWFNAAGEPDFELPVWYEFMAAEVEDFFAQFPHVDGLFCWNCECSLFTPTRLKHQRLPTAEIARRAIRAVYDVCQKLGKTMCHDIHAKGADAELSRGIIAAAADMPQLILGGDATYSDWQMHLPTTPFLEEMARNNRFYVGFDAAGEFFGQGRTIAFWPRWITKHFANALPHKPAAISIRAGVSHKENSCFLLPMLELNLRLLGQLGLHGKVDVDQEIRAWWPRHFQGQLPAGMDQVLLSFEEYLEKALYINASNITEYNPDHGFPHRAVAVAKGYPVWHSEQFTRPGTVIDKVMTAMIPPWAHRSRPVQELRQEKLDAIAICARSRQAVTAMTMDEEDRRYFLTCLDKARDFAQAFLLTIEVVHPLYQILGEHHDASMTDPPAALREALARFEAHIQAIDERWGPHFYRRFTTAMRDFVADIPAELRQPAAAAGKK